jgi:hypothetical protein
MFQMGWHEGGLQPQQAAPLGPRSLPHLLPTCEGYIAAFVGKGKKLTREEPAR